MPRTYSAALGKLIEAQAKLDEAAQLVISARLNTIDSSGAEDDFRGTELERAMDKFAAGLTETSYEVMEPMVRDLAALLPE